MYARISRLRYISIRIFDFYNPQCLVDGGWTQWTKWSECSVDCGSGKQTSRRDCANPFPSPNGGKACEGEGKRSRKCDKGPCPGEPSYVY